MDLAFAGHGRRQKGEKEKSKRKGKRDIIVWHQLFFLQAPVALNPLFVSLLRAVLEQMGIFAACGLNPRDHPHDAHDVDFRLGAVIAVVFWNRLSSGVVFHNYITITRIFSSLCVVWSRFESIILFQSLLLTLCSKLLGSAGV